MDLISIKWLTILAGAATWTTLFSVFNAPRIRGWRNLGLLACFMLGMAMCFILPWRSALATWGVAGVFSGLVYFGYETFVYLRTSAKAAVAKPTITSIVHGLFVWPIMLPEAVEYLLAELGVLKGADTPQEREGT